MPDNMRGPEARSPVSELLVAWGHGDEAAFEALIPIVHSELRGLVTLERASRLEGTKANPSSILGVRPGSDPYHCHRGEDRGAKATTRPDLGPLPSSAGLCA